MTKIIFQYQAKVNFIDKWEVRELIYNCNPNKTDKENLDGAFEKACSLGCDPNKNAKWKFVDDNN